MTVVRFALALAIIVCLARALGRAAEWSGQPALLGEIVAGLLLGPSVLGAVAPSMTAAIFPAHVVPLLAWCAQAGVVLYMFLVGTELTADALLLRGRAALIIALAGFLAPLVLGIALAWGLSGTYAPPDVPFAIFAAFIGLSLSVTALAVLARLLRDWRLSTSPLGALALASAAVSDGVALSLLGVLSGFARARGGRALATGVLGLGLVAVMVAGIAPAYRAIARRAAARPRPVAVLVPAVLIGLLASAAAAHAAGIEALIGAFLFGALLPRTAHLPFGLTQRVDRLVTAALLPAFFALTGLRTQVGLLTDVRAWLICGGIVAVASIGKAGGTWAASRLVGLGRQEALSLAVLMNTRGLVELVVLNIGLELGILTPALFTMLVIMALVTTFAAPPLFQLVVNRGHSTT